MDLQLSFELFLIPGFITGLLGFMAAAFKVYEYYHTNGMALRHIDLLMWVAVLTRVGLGVVYLFQAPEVVTETMVEIRFLITLLLLVEIMRGIRKIIQRQNTKAAIRGLGWPEGEYDVKR